MFDIGKIGVSIVLANGVSAVLSVIAKDLMGVNKHIGDMERNLGKVRLAALALGGAAVLGALGAMTKAAMGYNQQIAQMKMANFSPADIDTLVKQGRQTMIDVPGSNLEENQKNLTDLRNISGSAGHAVALSDNIARLNLLLENISKHPAGQSGYAFMKFLEDSGRMTDPTTGQFSEARVAFMSRWMQNVEAAENGRVTGEDMLQLRRSGKASVNMLNDQGLTNLVPFIQGLSAESVGTALQGARQQLLGSVLLRGNTVKTLEAAGLLDAKKVHHGGGYGQGYSLDEGALKNEQGMQRDLVGWVWNTYEPALRAAWKKSHHGAEATAEDLVSMMGREGLRTPLQGLIADAIMNEVTRKKEIGNINRTAAGPAPYDTMVKESPTFRVTEFTTAFNNLMIVLGSPMVDTATKMLQPLTDAMNRWTVWAADPKNKSMVEVIESIAAGLSALAVGAGLIAAGTIAGAALLALGGPLGMIAVVGTAAAVTAANLDKLHDAIQNLLPAFLKPGTDPNGKPPLDNMTAPGGSAKVPWWWPLPAGPGGREAAPFDANLNHRLELHKQSYLTPQADKPVNVQTVNYIQLDSKTIAKSVSNQQARTLDLPPAGTNRFDPSMSVSHPADQIAL